MKIKITGSSSDSYWYANKIGEVFEVLKEEESAYKVGYRWVQKTDCIPYKEEPKEEPKEDQLYICDHAEECNQNCTSGVAHIKTTGCGCNSCNFFDEPVKCIPYKEEPEGSEYIHIADGLEDEKSEPETVEDVLERIPLVSEHRKAFLNGDDNATMSKYISRLEAWQKDLKAAQEVE